MKMFRPLIGVALVILFFASPATTFAAPKGKKAKAAAPAPAAAEAEIDPDNPFKHDLKRIKRYQDALAKTQSASKKKRLEARIKKYQADIKKDHAAAVERLKRVIHDKERALKFENHKPFREKIEKEIKRYQDMIEKMDKWAGIEKKKDAKDGKAPAAPAAAKGKGGKAPAPAGKGPASAEDLGLDLAM